MTILYEYATSLISTTYATLIMQFYNPECTEIKNGDRIKI